MYKKTETKSNVIDINQAQGYSGMKYEVVNI